MKKPNIGQKPSRHPAVVDVLVGSPTGGTPPGASATGTAPGGSAASSPASRSPRGKTLTALGAVTAVVVAGAVTAGQMGGADREPAQSTATATADAAENGLPILNLPDPEPTEEPAASDGECRAERGDQKSGAGVIAAFNHAYYSQRNGEAARALATPTSSVLPGADLQKVIDAVPIGTNYCLRTVELSDGVYLVDLSVMQPAQPAKRGTQTVTTEEVDGKWYVDVFN